MDLDFFIKYGFHYFTPTINGQTQEIKYSLVFIYHNGLAYNLLYLFTLYLHTYLQMYIIYIFSVKNTISQLRDSKRF